jgi:uncharacterized protein (TIGR03083 family)
MARFMNKAQFLAECQAEFDVLERLIAPLSAEEKTQPGMLGEWSVKDVLAHLYEWQQLMLGWQEAGLRGENPKPPGRGYNWKQLPALNQEIYETHKDAPLEEIEAKLRESHRRMLALAESTPEEELFAAGCAAWMGKHSLATFINANAPEHYRWAYTAMRKQMKQAKKAQG